jgi:hypothetical protein
VDHIGTLFHAIGVDEGHVKPLGLVEIELDRRELPLSSSASLILQVDLRTVKRTAALINSVLKTLGLDRTAQRFGRGIQRSCSPTLFFSGLVER